MFAAPLVWLALELAGASPYLRWPIVVGAAWATLDVIVNLLPLRFGGTPSDGLQLLRVLRGADPQPVASQL